MIAHNRKEYLLDALQSLANQTIERNRFEVIIVKNFEDGKADSYASDNHFTIINTSVVSANKKLYLGLLSSRGSVICFLEDDDLFIETKIASVEAAFNQNRGLGYYHNNHFLDSSHKLNISTENHRGSMPETDSEISIYEPRIGVSEIHRLIRERAFFNISSIAVSRELLLLSSKHFGPELFGYDYSLFYSALIFNRRLAIDNRKFTIYRLHGSNNYSANFQGVSLNDFIKQRLELHQTANTEKCILLERMSSLSTDSNATKTLNLEIVCDSLDHLLLSDAPDKRQLLDNFSSFVRACPRYDFKLLSFYFLFSLLSLFASRLSSKMYFLIIFRLRGFH